MKRPIPTRDRLPSYVFGVAFTPDGKSLVSVSHDSSSRIWDIDSGRMLKQIDGLEHWPRCVSISPNGKTLAIGIIKSVSIYGLDDGRPKLSSRFPALNVTPDALRFSPDGRLLAFGLRKRLERGGYLSQVQVVDVASGKVDTTINWPDNEGLRAFAFSSDGKQLAVGSLAGTVRIWQVANWERIREFPGDGYNPVVALMYRPDGDVVVARYRKGVVVRDAKTGHPRPIVEGLIGHCDLSPDGDVLATVTLVDDGDTNLLTLWDVETTEKLAELSRSVSFNCVRFSPDGKSLATGNRSPSRNGDANRGVIVWDVAKFLERGVPTTADSR